MVSERPLDCGAVGSGLIRSIGIKLLCVYLLPEVRQDDKNCLKIH